MAPTTVLAREVFDATGRRLVLRGAGRSGGEGTVYEIEGRPFSLAKIYHRTKVSPELRAKIEAMRAAPPQDVAWDTQRHRSIAWVEQLVFHDAGHASFAGFTMPAIDTRRFRESHLYFDPQDRVRVFGGGFTWRHLLGAATNLASAIAAVHSQGHRIGDLRETNVLLSPASLIALIDCDSFQIRGPARVFYSRVGTADFLPPELQGADFRVDHDRTYADLFALGVLVFKMLMEGAHPYQARGPRVDDLPSTDAKIKRGLFPYERARGVEPPPFAPPYEMLPPEVRALFRRCFVVGHKHPSKRPSASEWFQTLKETGKRMRSCRANPNHWFGAHLRRCPWCAMASDPFPQPGVFGKQVTVKPPQVRTVQPRQAAHPTAVTTAGVTPSPKPQRLRRAWRLLVSVGRIRISRRRLIAIASALAFLTGLVSPLGHASPPPVATSVAWSARASGPCPFDPRARATPPQGCSAAWSFGPATHVSRDTRRLFLLRTSSRLLEVSFAVRFGSNGCVIPWIDSLSFNTQAASVCLATCPERIELRSEAGVHALVKSGGVAARGGPIRCGDRYRGTWTFDVARARGRIFLHYPGLKDLRLPLP